MASDEATSSSSAIAPQKAEKPVTLKRSFDIAFLVKSDNEEKAECRKSAFTKVNPGQSLPSAPSGATTTHSDDQSTKG